LKPEKASDDRINPKGGTVMSENLSKLFVTQFSDLLVLKLQQMNSKLRGRVKEGFHQGKQASPIQYIGNISMQSPAGRFAPLNRQDVDFTRRWVFPVDKEASQMIDSFDKLKTIIEPTSQYSAVAAAAVAREWDDRIIASAFASAQIGTDAGSLTTETFSTTSWSIAVNFGASANTGLTAAKFIEAKRIFRKAEVDIENTKVTMVTNSQGESDLLKQTTIVSTDFNDKPVLVNGVVTRFLGMDIVYSERLSSNGSLRKNIALTEEGAYLGIWKDVSNNVSQETQLSGQPYQLYTSMSCGATRLEPGRLLEVDCADASAAADVTP
jgi:hypothetical protein